MMIGRQVSMQASKQADRQQYSKSMLAVKSYYNITKKRIRRAVATGNCDYWQAA